MKYILQPLYRNCCDVDVGDRHKRSNLVWCKTAIAPLLMYWRYHSLALSRQYVVHFVCSYNKSHNQMTFPFSIHKSAMMLTLGTLSEATSKEMYSVLLHHTSGIMQDSGPRLNIKTVLPRYGVSHVKDKMVARPSYLEHGSHRENHRSADRGPQNTCRTSKPPLYNHV